MIWFAIAWVLHLIAAYLYISSGLVAPPWAVGVLMVIWLAFMWLLVRMRRRGPKTLLVPVGAVAVWFLLLWGGGALLGWTA